MIPLPIRPPDAHRDRLARQRLCHLGQRVICIGKAEQCLPVIHRNPWVCAFFLLKMQEELGELTRRFLEMTGGEHQTEEAGPLRREFEGDCASVVGNALILARQFGVDLESRIIEKVPAG